MALPDLVDSHCHLTWDSFRPDFDAVLSRMRERGVAQAVIPATSVAVAHKALELARAHSNLFAAAGTHPNDVPDDFDAELAQLDALLGTGDFVGVGETGLDYYRDSTDPIAQRRAFEAHADLALKYALPIIVHIRDRDGVFRAYDDVADVIASKPGLTGVIHCFSGNAAYARRFVDLGFHVSFSGILTFKNGQALREAAKVVPLDRVLVETDAPFLVPEPNRGKIKRCEPAFVADTARILALTLERDEAEVRAATTANTRRLFRLTKPG